MESLVCKQSKMHSNAIQVAQQIQHMQSMITERHRVFIKTNQCLRYLDSAASTTPCRTKTGHKNDTETRMHLCCRKFRRL